MDVEAALDRLYAQPLDGFIAERDALARRLKDDGDAEASGRIKKLTKPSVAAWALNQLARENESDVAELLAIRDELEKADSPAELRRLSGRRREVVARLTAAGKAILAKAGHGTSQTTLEKISQGLLASGTDEDRELLKRGRLTREPTGSGLEGFGFAAAGDVEEEATPKVALKTRREVERLRRDAERLQQEAARLLQEAEFAEEQARRARAKAEEAASAADAAREKANAAAESAGL